MTNEEAINKLKEVQADFNENWVDYGGINEAFEKAYQALIREEEWEETKHRLNLLIDVLHSNHAIWQNDIEYIEDSIKNLRKGAKAVQNE